MLEELPSEIKLTPKESYQLVFIKEFQHENVLGECDPNARQIKIKAGLSNKQTVSVLIHEIVHAMSFTHELNITENRTEGLELALVRLFRYNKDLVTVLLDKIGKR